MADWNSGPTFSLFGFDAAQGSPIGGLFAGLQSFSIGANAIASTAGAGALAVIQNPTLSAKIVTSPNGAASLSPTEQRAFVMSLANPLPQNPFALFGRAAGGIFGTGVAGVGTIAGNAGQSAAPGLGAGAAGVTYGATTATTATATGALSGFIPGITSGITSGFAGAQDMLQGLANSASSAGLPSMSASSGNVLVWIILGAVLIGAVLLLR